jgi:hypothetical protein
MCSVFPEQHFIPAPFVFAAFYYVNLYVSNLNKFYQRVTP